MQGNPEDAIAIDAHRGAFNVDAAVPRIISVGDRTEYSQNLGAGSALV